MNLQMWVLNDDGTLMNSYSGLCTAFGPIKGDTLCFFSYRHIIVHAHTKITMINVAPCWTVDAENVNSNEVRSWIATGRRGEWFFLSIP